MVYTVSQFDRCKHFTIAINTTEIFLFLFWTIGCQKDRVSIFSYTGNGKKYKLEKVICGTTGLDEVLSVDNNKVFIEFISDGNINARGFAMSYASHKDPGIKFKMITLLGCGVYRDIKVRIFFRKNFNNSINNNNISQKRYVQLLFVSLVSFLLLSNFFVCHRYYFYDLCVYRMWRHFHCIIWVYCFTKLPQKLRE